jgi:hypothetical protein
LAAEVFDLPACGLALVGVHFGGPRARQSSLGAAHDRGGHLQIAQQSGGPRCGNLRFGWRVGFEK